MGQAKRKPCPKHKSILARRSRTEGINVHIEDLKKLFVHAPDTRIKEHPIKFGSGNYTLVTGVFEGTFTRPMATVGIWENGVMKEEHLFWDNQTYVKQIGLQ